MAARPPELQLTFHDRQAFDDALVGALGRGKAFVPGGGGAEPGQRCLLVVVHPVTQRRLALRATVAWVKEPAADGPGGVGVALSDEGEDLTRKLERFAQGKGGESDDGASMPQSINVQLRGLSSVEQQRLARRGSLQERLALERIYGKAVWDALLRNPSVTVPEVARMARMGSLPQSLVDLITDNQGWVRASPIRRALLSNPRLRGECMLKVLRATPSAELRLIPQSAAYPPPVRNAAKRMTGG